MRFLQNLLICAIFAIIWACNPSSKKEDSYEKVGLKAGKTTREIFGGCDTTTNTGAAVRIQVWIPSDSSEASANIRSELNKKIIERINSYADSASIAANPIAAKSAKGAYEVFAKNYSGFKKEFRDAPGCWEVELKGDTVMVTPEILIYQLDHYAFTGGAHPNSFKSLHIFDGQTGKEKEMKKFVSDSLALLKKVESTFRKVEKLASDINLEEEGYFLKNNHFFLPANYVFTREGVFFYYNPYEIAPYVKGAIQFTIPYAELEGMVRKDF